MDEADSRMIVNALLDIGWDIAEACRPSVLFKPSVYMDGNAWCALLGDDIQVGVCGFGMSPDAACRAFDAEWFTCTDTTCGSNRCPKCVKAKTVEKVLEAKDGDASQG